MVQIVCKSKRFNIRGNSAKVINSTQSKRKIGTYYTSNDCFLINSHRKDNNRCQSKCINIKQ